jgi:hypothetical protein
LDALCSKVNEVCNEDPDSDEQLIAADNGTADMSWTAFSLIHRH